jgi:hypothetical protein
VGFHTYRNIKSLFQKENHDKKYIPPEVHWFDGTEILTARGGGDSKEENNKDNKSNIFIAAKGGHNDESHNHNDIGHFILYSNENPVVIDVGVGTYTKKTFSSERYDIWTMQSCYHNAATVNGFDQTPGEHRHADDVHYTHENGVTDLSMQLKNAYPDEAGIESYTREFIFEHGKSFTVHDKYSLKQQCASPFIFNLMCANKPETDKNDGNIIQLGENIEMVFDGGMFTASIEEIELTDTRLKNDWQRNYLYRIRLTEKEMKKESDITVCFRLRN